MWTGIWTEWIFLNFHIDTMDLYLYDLLTQRTFADTITSRDGGAGRSGGNRDSRNSD